MSYNNGDFGETNSTAGMFSYPSSPLFEQPFANRDFFAEQTPLRSRGNGGTNSGENGFFNATTNPFSNERRKRSLPSPDRWVKYLMRFVLLSPLIVLVIWSVCAMLFTSHNRRQTMAATAPQQQQQPRAQAGLIVQPKSLQSSSMRENIEEGFLEGVEVVSEALGEAQPQAIQLPQAVTPIMGSAQQQQAQAQPMQSISSAQQLPQQAAPRLQVQALQQQQPMGESAQVQAPLQQQVGGIQQQAPLQGNILPQLLPQASKSNKSTSRAANLVQKVEGFLSPPKSGSSANQQQVPQQQVQAPAPQLRGGQRNIVYYYYDPRDTGVGPQGEVILPSILYDEAGNAMESSRIQQASKVYLQPPLYGSTASSSESSSSKSNLIPVMDPLKGYYNHPKVVSERVTHSRKSSLAMPSKDSFNHAMLRVEQQQGGSSVIVATVAVMALLVGAISARKLRGAGALANCIENERLDHVAAYDTATESNTAYSTFHWKGDLEKFDV